MARRLIIATRIALSVVCCVGWAMAQSPRELDDPFAPIETPSASPPTPEPLGDNDAPERMELPDLEEISNSDPYSNTSQDPVTPPPAPTPEFNDFDDLAADPPRPADEFEPNPEIPPSVDPDAPYDPEVIPAQSPDEPGEIEPPGATPVPSDGGGSRASSDPRRVADRLPVGPQSVGLTVEAMAPPTVNLHQETTLTITVRNTSNADAYGVIVRDALPSSLEFLGSTPQPNRQEPQGTYVWELGTLGANQAQTIEVRVKPMTKDGFDHAPTVELLTGAKSRTTVHEPKLEIKLTPSRTRVLKGKNVDFKITVENTGNGPARNVEVRARISKGLIHDGNHRDFQLDIGSLGPGEKHDLPLFTVDADDVGQEETCTLIALSPDIISSQGEKILAQSVATVEVVAPRIQLKIEGPAERHKGTDAEYKIIVENAGTAPALNVQVGAFPGLGGTAEVPSDAKVEYSTPSKIYWVVKRLEAGQKQEFRLPVRFDEIRQFALKVGANAQSEEDGEQMGTVYDQAETNVIGMARVQFVNVETGRQILDVGDKTELEIRIRNFGSKEATKVQVGFLLSENLQVQFENAGDQLRKNPDNPEEFVFAPIERLDPGAEHVFRIEVSASQSGLATCRVIMTWDDLEGAQIDMSTYTTIAGEAVRR